MPVAQGSQISVRQGGLLALGAILTVLTFVFFVTRIGSLGNGGTEIPIQLGEPVFAPGNAGDLAAVIDTEGPILLPDASGGDRDIVINHLGNDPEAGWVAFAARDLTAPRDCFVEWQAAEEIFVDTCTAAEYPADGKGLQGYGTSISTDGDLVINLNVVKPSGS